MPVALNHKYFYNNYSEKEGMPYAAFVAISHLFFKLLFKRVLRGEVFQLPFLGTLGVFKKKTYGGGKIDFKYFNETGIKKKFTNLHTDGYISVITLIPPTKFFGRRLISYCTKFRPTRDLKRELASIIKTELNQENYFHLDDYKFSKIKRSAL